MILKLKIQLAPQDILSIVLLAGCYPLAQVLPPECGWENGLIENTQAVLLLFGAMFCFNCAYYSVKGLGYTIGWLYFIMFLRELSWGRVFFPTGAVDELGPKFVSMSSIPQHDLINTAIGLAIIILLYGIYKYLPLKQFLFEIPFPVISATVGIIALMLQYGGENCWFTALSHPQNQMLEEFAEMIVYTEMLNMTHYYGFQYLRTVKK
ncbi:MAG: hypothetical protein DBY32_03020 [Phascolarctobacterium sp.]|nr:MAG: hypothetical protein DBY32_03020 [Phascolarctobacterium sp.]